MKKGKMGLALTWDGARWPVRRLPPRARVFLGQTASRPSLTAALKNDSIGEIRICWVPRLKGGNDALSEPFPTPDLRRLSFRMKRTVRFGDVLGVVYTRSSPAGFEA